MNNPNNQKYVKYSPEWEKRITALVGKEIDKEFKKGEKKPDGTEVQRSASAGPGHDHPERRRPAAAAGPHRIARRSAELPLDAGRRVQEGSRRKRHTASGPLER